jgi:DNA-directed RNA polymerase subunit RPC12/RpoP
MTDILIPIGLLCVFVALFVGVTIGFTYLWLLWYNASMTRCPECGKRGAGELVNSRVLSSKSYLDQNEMKKGKVVRITEKTHEDEFECQYCGHRWTSMAEHTQRLPAQ